ncbi:MAG: hypothetical protein H5T81_12350 [Tetrasphaera sp.]|nr:hypothetical protein [Tetrasphaera sp.]
MTDSSCVPAAVRSSIIALSPTKQVVLGGVATVSDAAAANVGCLASSVPTISGTLEVGETLTANPGVWTAGTAFSYQWFANGVAAGTGQTLTLTSAHQGKRMTVGVTGSLAGYVSLARTSAATAAVKAGPPRYPDYVTPGAFCAQAYAGWIGYTVTGVKMRCTTSATDSRLRWRAA